jgi:hypothetical protein
LLVGGFNHLEKYESQLGLLFPFFLMGKKTCLKPPSRLVCDYSHDNPPGVGFLAFKTIHSSDASVC